MNRRLVTVLALAAFLFVFTAVPINAYAAAPADLDWKLTYAEGNQLLKAHLNASADEMPNTATGNPTGLLFGSLFLVAGAVLLKRRGLN